jgi:hypothetical protein
MTRHRFSNGTVPNRMSFECNKTAIRKTEAFHAQGKLSTTHATRPTEKQELRQGLILQPRHTALRHSAQPRLNDKIISSTVYTHSHERRASHVYSTARFKNKELPPPREALTTEAWSCLREQRQSHKHNKIVGKRRIVSTAPFMAGHRERTAQSLLCLRPNEDREVHNVGLLRRGLR